LLIFLVGMGILLPPSLPLDPTAFELGFAPSDPLGKGVKI